MMDRRSLSTSAPTSRLEEKASFLRGRATDGASAQKVSWPPSVGETTAPSSHASASPERVKMVARRSRTPHLDQTRRMLSMARKPGRRRLGLDACGASHLTVTVECLKSPQRRTRNGECYGTAATTNCGARKR